ncbi:hypothetical protein NCS57_00033100 [Fusarium keratoplasticum]|uniref:Uncharacterized protein n=1 Tax=Fusarium keratoplasticum TaxID=1328300 RepID=A0ACC0RFQ0_9HYPO|nr:hypothetical protein NCS57_00033100 [Fusarium keratoplasticum]KAI8683684.1 hypothetical protein NCS57_00033100 [Fusarium keratoplasticum]
MGEPMGEDPIPQVGEKETVPETQEETLTSTTDPALVRRRKKLLERIALTLHFDFQALPSEAQEAYWKFQEDRGFSRFAIDLQRLLLNHKIDSFLHQCPAFLLAVAELFDEKHPQLGLRELCEEQGLTRDDESTLEARPSDFGTRYLPRDDESDVDDSEGQHRPSAQLSRTITLTSHTRQPGTMGPWNHGSLRLMAGQITDDEESPTQAPELEPTKTKPLIPGFVISTKRTPLISPGEKEKDTTSDKQPPETSHGSARDIRSQEEYNSGWLRNFAGDRSVPPPDFNLYPYKGWKIEPPQVLISRAKNFLADEDVNRTVDWDRKFAELAEYFSYLLHNWKGERWGADLHECIDMLHAHRLFEDYHYGRPKLNLDFPDKWTIKSWRLPRVPGHHVVVEDEEDMGERKLLFNPIRAAHDVHYEMPQDVLKKYVDEYGQDAEYFWSSSHGVEPRPERLSDEDPNNRRFNMVECENNAYEKSILKNMQETCSQLRSQPRPPAEQVKGTPDTNSLRQFAWFRGTRRAALQQCLSQFSNAENAAVCNQWRAIILPPPKKSKQPDAGVLFTTMQVADIPEKEARDPFSYTLAHKWFITAEQWWGAWMRPHSIKESYGQRLWLHRKEAIMELPHNFKGPYVVDYFDKDMRKTQELLNKCQIIWDRLDDKEKHFNREFLTKIVKCVWEGLRSGEGSYLEQGSLVRNDGATPVPHIRPLEEELLRFILEPSVNATMLGIKQGADAGQGEEEGISPILSAHGQLFEERVDEMLNDISRDSFFHPAVGPKSQDFMEVLNRDCGGPMKRYRFSRKEAIRYALALKRKGKIYANKDLVVRRPKVDFHPEERIRWLESDNEVEPPPPVEPKMGPVKTKAKDDDGVTISTDISTEVTEPESVDLGPYAKGLPKLANIRSWDETILDRQAVSTDMEKTLVLFEGLGYRLGRTLRDLRKQHAKDLKSLTPEQRKVNSRYVRDIYDWWELDYPLRANDPKWNPNMVDDSWKNRVTPKFCDTIKMAEPEAYQESWDRERGFKDIHDSVWVASDMLRKGIIREAYENKSMLFPTRVTRRIDDTGKTIISAPRREPVWSFGHPERCGKGPRFWSIDRWPLHLQSEETRDLIESSGPDDSVCVVPPSMGGKPPKRTKKKRTKGARRFGEEAEEQRDTTMEDAEESEAHDISLRHLGQPFGSTYRDQAHIRRRFKPGTPEYWLGDTPLQKRRVEERIKSGLVGSEQPRSWRQRLADLLGSKGDDPTALPYVNPRYIPKSKPLPSETEQDSPVLLPVSSEDIPSRRPPPILAPAGDRLRFKPWRNQADSPMNPSHWDDTAKDDEQEDSRQEPESTYAFPGDFTSLVPSITRMTPPPPPEDKQAGSSTAGPQGAPPTGQRRRNSRPMESQRLQLEIVELEQNESERPPRDPEDEALYRALHEEFYDPYA